VKKSALAGGLRLRLIKKLTHIFNRPDPLENNAAPKHGCEYPCQPLVDLQASLTALETTSLTNT